MSLVYGSAVYSNERIRRRPLAFPWPPKPKPYERAALVAQAARYLAGVRDYRGFDARDGSRHGVAHGADLALQLSLNPALDQPMGEALLSANASQVLPSGEHAWRFGEAERLMAPVFHLGRRTWWTPVEWQTWFDGLLARRAPLAVPTPLGLAQRHNLVAFLSALYVTLLESTDAEARAPSARIAPGSAGGRLTFQVLALLHDHQGTAQSLHNGTERCRTLKQGCRPWA